MYRTIIIKVATVCGVPKTDMYFNFYTHRIVRLWNKLPITVKCSELSDNGTNFPFKLSIKRHYKELMYNEFDQDNLCSWTTVCKCVRCRTQ